jgi:hypothetical protein
MNGNEALLIRRGDIMRLTIGGKPAGISERMLREAIRRKRLKPHPVPGRTRRVYLRAHVLEVFGLN